MSGFSVSWAFGMALGFMFGVGCAAAVLYTIYQTGYRHALRDVAAGGTSKRYLEESEWLARHPDSKQKP